jgi:hypothetical protein
VTNILGDDSLIHNKAKTTPKSIAAPPRSTARVRQDGDSTGNLGLGLVICLFMLCYWFLFSYMNDTLFKSFSMHLYVLSYMI